MFGVVRKMNPTNCPKCNEELRADLTSEGKLTCMVHGEYVFVSGRYKFITWEMKEANRDAAERRS
jgi:hypothetical protein